MTKFLHGQTNLNNLLREAVFTWAMGYFMLKAGIRKNNHLHVLCGKDLLGQLFFSQNHPIYRKLYLYMDIDRVSMPEYMREQSDKLVGIKVEGKGCDKLEEPNIGENFYFCVEAVNKSIKANLHWAPSQWTWMVACRTFSVFVELKKKYFNG